MRTKPVPTGRFQPITHNLKSIPLELYVVEQPTGVMEIEHSVTPNCPEEEEETSSPGHFLHQTEAALDLSTKLSSSPPTFIRPYDTTRIKEQEAAGTGNLVCPECQKTFRFEKNLLRHLQKSHFRGNCDESVLKCKLCPYSTRHYSNMYVHIRTHTGDKPYWCSACGASFTQGSSLKLHIKSRHNDNTKYFSLAKKPGKNNLTKLWTRVLKKDLTNSSPISHFPPMSACGPGAYLPGRPPLSLPFFPAGFHDFPLSHGFPVFPPHSYIPPPPISVPLGSGLRSAGPTGSTRAPSTPLFNPEIRYARPNILLPSHQPDIPFRIQPTEGYKVPTGDDSPKKRLQNDIAYTEKQFKTDSKDNIALERLEHTILHFLDRLQRCSPEVLADLQHKDVTHQLFSQLGMSKKSSASACLHQRQQHQPLHEDLEPNCKMSPSSSTASSFTSGEHQSSPRSGGTLNLTSSQTNEPVKATNNNNKSTPDPVSVRSFSRPPLLMCASLPPDGAGSFEHQHQHHHHHHHFQLGMGSPAVLHHPNRFGLPLPLVPPQLFPAPDQSVLRS